jgi:hypothetical protein
MSTNSTLLRNYVTMQRMTQLRSKFKRVRFINSLLSQFLLSDILLLLLLLLLLLFIHSFVHVPLHPQQAKAYRYSNMSIYNIAIHMKQSS